MRRFSAPRPGSRRDELTVTEVTEPFLVCQSLSVSLCIRALQPPKSARHQLV